MDVNRTDRLYALVEELRGSSPRARTSRQLAARFEVSVRTIERDISALQQSGVPIWATPGPGGGYTIDPAMTLPPLNFTADEATAIAVALALSGPMPFAGAARTALRKVVGAMSVDGQDRARDLASRIHLAARGDRALSVGSIGAVLLAVEEAVARRRVLALDYTDRGGVRTARRLVEPYGLAGIGGHWYLLAWCRLRDGGRTFRMDRIASARVTDELAPARRLDEVAADMPSSARAALTLE